MEELVPYGPGSIRIFVEDETAGLPSEDWLPAEVSLHFETTGEEAGTDTIAVLDLDAMEIGAEHVKVMQRIQIELTRDDLINLMEKFRDVAMHKGTP